MFPSKKMFFIFFLKAILFIVKINITFVRYLTFKFYLFFFAKEIYQEFNSRVVNFVIFWCISRKFLGNKCQLFALFSVNFPLFKKFWIFFYFVQSIVSYVHFPIFLRVLNLNVYADHSYFWDLLQNFCKNIKHSFFSK